MSKQKGKRGKRVRVVAGLAVTLAACGVITALVFSQMGNQGLPGFDSGSDGSDGALILTEPGTILFDPMDFTPPLDQDGDGVYHFISIHIGQGVTVKLSAIPLGTKPVVWLSSGTVQIDGTIDLNGEDGHDFSALVYRPSIAGAGGYEGGIGGGPDVGVPTAGRGPGAGGAGLFPPDPYSTSRGGIAGHASDGRGESDFGQAGKAYGNNFLLPLLGGSGGGGCSVRYLGNRPGGGGAGGGAMLIASSVSVMVGGSISANGGNGGNAQGTFGIARMGGPGSGGAIRIVAPTVQGSGNLTAFGGTAANGVLGSKGRIRLEAFEHLFKGTADPQTRFATPGPVSPPSGTPSVRVTSVAGVVVPTNPRGSFTPVDLVINEASDAIVELEATKIPPGTRVQLDMYSEDAPARTIESAPLVGTLDRSTATATVKIPPGFSRFFVMATWDPNQ